MKAQALLLVALLAPLAHAEDYPTADFPRGADWTLITRPPGFLLSASSHTDMDEFPVPLSAYDGSAYGRTALATGAVDYLAYSGPPSTSTLQTFATLSTQLTTQGFKPVFTCVRQACGGYSMGQQLSHPLIDTLSSTGYHNLNVETFGAVTGDVRYAAFQRGDEFLCLLTALNPGKFSGVLLIDIGGHNPLPPPPPVATAAPPAAAAPVAASPIAATPPPARFRTRLGTLLRTPVSPPPQ